MASVSAASISIFTVVVFTVVASPPAVVAQNLSGTSPKRAAALLMCMKRETRVALISLMSWEARSAVFQESCDGQQAPPLQLPRVAGQQNRVVPLLVLKLVDTILMRIFA
jgi:hypothetical protein